MLSSISQQKVSSKRSITYNILNRSLKVTKQLNEGKDPADVEVSLNLSQVKPAHAKWIFEIYKYL